MRRKSSRRTLLSAFTSSVLPSPGRLPATRSPRRTKLSVWLHHPLLSHDDHSPNRFLTASNSDRNWFASACSSSALIPSPLVVFQIHVNKPTLVCCLLFIYSSVSHQLQQLSIRQGTNLQHHALSSAYCFSVLSAFLFAFSLHGQQSTGRPCITTTRRRR